MSCQRGNTYEPVEMKQMILTYTLSPASTSGATVSTTSTDNKKSSSTASKSTKSEETNTIKYQELLQQFKAVQSRHEKQRRQCKFYKI